MKTEFFSEAAKGTPAVAGAIVAWVTALPWVAQATGIYVLIQAAYLLRKWYREEKDYAATQARKRKAKA
jgi:hypothetical protein